MKKLLLAAVFFATAAVQNTQAQFTFSWFWQVPVVNAYYPQHTYNCCSGCHLCYSMCTCHYPISYYGKPDPAADTEGFALLAGIFGGVAYAELVMALLKDNSQDFEAFQVATGLSGVAAIVSFLSSLAVQEKDKPVVNKNSKDLLLAGTLLGIMGAAFYQLLN